MSSVERTYGGGGADGSRSCREAPDVDREAPDVDREAPDVDREAPDVDREAPDVDRDAGGNARFNVEAERRAIFGCCTCRLCDWALSGDALCADVVGAVAHELLRTPVSTFSRFPARYR